MVSGDHIIGRVSLYYDFGWTPDPAGEFLTSLDTVEGLQTDLILPGHGKPVRDLSGLVRANRDAVHERMGRVRDALGELGQPTPFEVVPKLMQTDDLNPMLVSWGLAETLAYLRHLEAEGKAEKVEGSDPERWKTALDGLRGPGPGLGGAQRGQDGARRGRAVERVEVDAADVVGKQVHALERRVRDAEVPTASVSSSCRPTSRSFRGRELPAAQLRDPHDVGSESPA